MILSILYFILFIAKHKKYKSNTAEIIDIENNLEEKKSKKSLIKKLLLFNIKYFCLILTIYLDLCFFYYNFFYE
jgi:hypothetical protein